MLKSSELHTFGSLSADTALGFAAFVTGATCSKCFECLQESQEYRPHFDTFFTSNGLNNGGNRLLTILVYLSDVEEGGETVFPNIAAPPHQTRENFSECAMQGMAVKPRKGDATVFWSLKTTGDLNPGSRHGSCPVIKGEKCVPSAVLNAMHEQLR